MSIHLLLARSVPRRRQALARWLDPGKGVPSPAVFVSDVARHADLRRLLGVSGFLPRCTTLDALWRELWLRHGDDRAVPSPTAEESGQPPTEVEARLVDLLGSPNATLRSWLRRVPTLIVDDLLSPSPIDVQLVLALARACSAEGATVVLCFESGRDLGGREAGAFFAYDDVDDAQESLWPFESTRALRHAAFDAFVGTGEATIEVALDRGTRVIEPGTPFAPPGEVDFADLLYGSSRVDRLPAGLQVWAADDPEDEVRAIARDIKARVVAGATPDEYAVGLADLPAYASTVQAVFEDFGLPEPGRVPVVDVALLRGLPTRHVYAGGLCRGVFGVRSGARDARFHLASLIRNHACDPDRETLTLSWPRTWNGMATARSALLAEILDRPWHEGGTVGDRLVSRPERVGIWCRTDALERADACFEHISEADRRAVRLQASAIDARSAPELGPFDGMLAEPPNTARTLSVSALETFSRCPQRYLYEHVLGFGLDESPGPEVDPRQRGTLLHTLLQRFYEQRQLKAAWADADDRPAREHLFRLAREAMSDLEDTPYQEHLWRTWTSGLADEAAPGILKAWLDGERSGPQSTPIALESPLEPVRIGEVRLTGVRDRVDRLPSGALWVRDYKTGLPPSRTDVMRGYALQPIAYTESGDRSPETGGSRRDAGRDRPAAKPVVFSYDCLRRPDEVEPCGHTGDSAALAEVTSGGWTLPASTRASLWAHASSAARLLRSGLFHTSLAPTEEAGCKHCPYRRICRVDRHRVVTTPNVHRPRSLDADASMATSDGSDSAASSSEAR